MKKILVKILYTRAAAWRFFRGLSLKNPKENHRRFWGMVFASLGGLLLAYLFFPLWLPMRQRIHKNFGGKLKALVSGGGTLSLQSDLFFQAMGIPLLEGYGMTETSPVISVRTLEHNMPSTVGRPLKDTEVRIVDPQTEHVLYPTAFPSNSRVGEVQVRGGHIMKGYYKDLRLTKKVLLKDGYLRTGDLGMFTWNGYLKIVGRLKDTIVLNNGENVEPEPLEQKLLESRFIEQAVVLGQDAKYLTALILPSLSWFSLEGISASHYADLAKHPKVQKIIEQEIERLIHPKNGFRTFERIQKFCLLKRPLLENIELSGLYKPKRHVVAKNFQQEIEAMYRSL